MPDVSCFNIPAQYCTSRLSEHGRRIVQYQGDDYVVVGFYFAGRHGGNANRTPTYILRPLHGDGQMGAPHSRRVE